MNRRLLTLSVPYVILLLRLPCFLCQQSPHNQDHAFMDRRGDEDQSDTGAVAHGGAGDYEDAHNGMTHHQHQQQHPEFEHHGPAQGGSENVEHEPHFGEHGQHRPGGPEEDQEWGNNAAPHRGFQPEAGFFPIGELSPDQLQELCNAAKDTVSKAAVSISGNSDRSGKISGSIEIVQNEGTGPITITGNISGLTPGQHGFKVYSYGNLKDGCNSGGKPFGVRQSNSSGGQSSDTKRYAGDLENIRADSSGAATFTLSDSVLSLNGDWSIIGRMLVISEEADNFGGYGQTNDAFDYSDSSKKIACGVVARVQETFTEINADDVAAVQVEDVKEEQVAAYEAALNGVEQPIYAFNFVTFAMLLVSIYVIQF